MLTPRNLKLERHCKKQITLSEMKWKVVSNLCKQFVNIRKYILKKSPYSIILYTLATLSLIAAFTKKIADELKPKWFINEACYQE